MRTVADLFAREMDEHLRLTEAVAAGQADAFAAAAGACIERLGTGGKLLLFGNGGSAADAQHLAAELTVRLRCDRRPIPALALTADTAVLTAAGNDLGFAQIFARQIEALGQAGDIALAISTSGRSPNVLEGLAAARRKGAAHRWLLRRERGRDGGLMRPPAGRAVGGDRTRPGVAHRAGAHAVQRHRAGARPGAGLRRAFRNSAAGTPAAGSGAPARSTASSWARSRPVPGSASRGWDAC